MIYYLWTVYNHYQAWNVTLPENTPPKDVMERFASYALSLLDSWEYPEGDGYQVWTLRTKDKQGKLHDWNMTRKPVQELDE